MQTDPRKWSSGLDNFLMAKAQYNAATKGREETATERGSNGQAATQEKPKNSKNTSKTSSILGGLALLVATSGMQCESVECKGYEATRVMHENQTSDYFFREKQGLNLIASLYVYEAGDSYVWDLDISAAQKATTLKKYVNNEDSTKALIEQCF